MINHIYHAGVLHVREISSDLPCVIISILDYYTPHSRPNFSHFKDSLSLSFKDRCEEEYGHEQLWPDEPTREFNESVLGMPNERICSISDARRIDKFFEEWHDHRETLNLIVHCKSGVGRSAAIAKFYGDLYDISYSGTDPRKRFFPNPRVIRMLEKTKFGKYEHEDNRSNKPPLQQLSVPQFRDTES